jgi:hypothetical protein
VIDSEINGTEIAEPARATEREAEFALAFADRMRMLERRLFGCGIGARRYVGTI